MSESPNSSRASTPDSAFHEDLPNTREPQRRSLTRRLDDIWDVLSQRSTYPEHTWTRIPRGNPYGNLLENAVPGIFPGERKVDYFRRVYPSQNFPERAMLRSSPRESPFQRPRPRIAMKKDWNINLQRFLTESSYNSLTSKNSVDTCHCLRRMYLGINRLKGFDRLNALQNFLDALVFKIPFKRFHKIMSNNWTYEDRDNLRSAINGDKSECKALTHRQDGDSIYEESDFIPKIKSAETRKDAWFIISLLKFASSTTMQNIYKKICIRKPDQEFCCRIILDEVKRQFIKTYSNKLQINHIWAGYKVDGFAGDTIGIDTLVVITNTPVPDNIKAVKDFKGLKILFRMQNECNKEAATLLVYERENAGFSDPMFHHQKALRGLLMNHSNLTLISDSCVRSKGFRIKKRRIIKTPTIVLYCQVKGVIPVGERPFPRSIGDFLVDVREGTCDLAGGPLRISEKIGTEELRKTGTIGGFVDLQNPQRKALLTCAHVVLPTNILKEKNDLEYVRRHEVNAFDKTHAKIGVVAKTVFNHGKSKETTVDAALIEIKDRYPSDGCFANVYTSNQLLAAGFSIMTPPYFSNGQIETISEHNFRKPILKIGASSGLTLGSLKIGRSNAQIIQSLDVNVDNSFRIRVYNQLEVIPRIDPSQPSDSPQAFLTDGDSGSFVYVITNENPLVLKCIGMAIAKTSYGSCLLTPIDKIFDALDLPYNCLSTFNFPESRSTRDSDSLTNMLAMISQQLTEVKSTMVVTAQDTKNELGQMKNSLQNINDRLFVAESEIKTLKKTDADNKDNKSNENET